MDWREDSYCMKSLIHKLYDLPQSSNHADVTFKLPDGSLVSAHKLILAVASPFFEAQFFGLLATEDSPVEVKNVESSSFRRVLEFIYKSGNTEWSHLDNLEYWNLLQAAHMYLVPGLISLCNKKLSNFLNTITDNRMLVEYVNRASQLYIYEGILSAGLMEIKSRLAAIIESDVWNQLEESVLLDILEDDKLKVSEGRLFQGMVDWCRYNAAESTPDVDGETPAPAETPSAAAANAAAIHKFQTKFASKVRVSNMTKATFLKTIGESEFTSPDLFKAWTFEFMKSDGVKLEATRFALHPLKIQQTVIERQDFLEPRGTNPQVVMGVDPMAEVWDSELWRTYDEYGDVNILIRIFQKVTESAATRSKFGILLETMHKAKTSGDRAAIKERVSVKMVAKKADGTVVKKLFKPIEDSNKESSTHRSNIFVLSKNKDERLQWHVMEIVVIIDRRPTCHIKGISGEEFAQTVCVGQTQNYLNKAVSLHYDVNMSIKETVEDIAKRLKVNEPTTQLSQWLYIFTKGYVSNLRSRRAMPNDYWTAETVEDYMRCKVINFPIGVHNEAMRRDAFRTWIISRKVADEKEKDKKNVFVCTYNPDIQDVRFLKTHSLPVETKVETLGLLEHISLGSVKVDEKFFHEVTLGVPVTIGVKIFIRRIFPIQNETDERMQRVLVTEAVQGTTLTHIDDCHVLVVQTKKTYPDSLDYDKFLLMKIREVSVLCINRHNPAQTVQLRVDPAACKSDILAKLSNTLCKPRNGIQIFKSYTGGTMGGGAGSVDPPIKDDETFENMFQYCEAGERKVLFEEVGGSTPPPFLMPANPPVEGAQPLEEGSLKMEEKWLDDMDTA